MMGKLDYLDQLKRAMLGLPPAPAPRRRALLAAPLGPNGPREHYMRACRLPDGSVMPLQRQDSSLLSALVEADCLIVQPPNTPAREVGESVEITEI